MKYLHIGSGQTLRQSEIIGIFDLDSATVSRVTKNYINRKQKEGALLFYEGDLPRSFVVTDRSVYLSRISADGLAKRCRDRGQSILHPEEENQSGKEGSEEPLEKSAKGQV